VKITWVLALVLTAIWLLVVVIGLVGSLLPESQETRRASEQQVRVRSPLDSSGFAAPAADGGTAALLRMVILFTQVVGAVLFLLWLRVLLESVIVIFNIAATLKSIEEKTARP
jgi:hypothetical protein